MSDYDDPYGDMRGEQPARPRQTMQSRSGSSGGDRTQAAIASGKYTEVNVRIQQFYADYPTGALVTVNVQTIPIDELDGAGRVMVQARAYRTPDDPHPGVGTSWMTVPGKTPYTNGSEVENCETSAWGRALAAIGILIDQGIASANEIRNARGEDSEPGVTGPADSLTRAAKVAAERPSVPPPDAPVKESTTEAVPVNAAGGTVGPTPAGIVVGESGPEADAKPKATKSKAKVVPDPEAKAADPVPDQGGMTYEAFVAAIREKLIPNGHVQAVARELVERKALPEVGGVRELTDDQRMVLYMACIVRLDDTPEDVK